MKQFDVFPTPREVFPERPYFVVIQHKLHFGLPNVAVVPLASRHYLLNPIKDLQPILALGHEELVLMAEEVTNVPMQMCRKVVGNLSAQSVKIVRALDVLMAGV